MPVARCALKTVPLSRGITLIRNYLKSRPASAARCLSAPDVSLFGVAVCLALSTSSAAAQSGSDAASSLVEIQVTALA